MASGFPAGESSSRGDANVTVLVVEDDIVDQEIVQRSFKRAKLSHPLIFAENGFEALKIMRGEHPKTKIQGPYMVLLDLNMPVMDGFEVLEEMRSDRELRDKVVFVLSTSDDEGDVKRAYSRGISGYIQKGDISEGFSEATKMLSSFSNVVIMP
ncbi:response regulator [Donghicola sp. C2-DW-16]|uniref:Response regulator n=1 Tax=Donghicola mangrovi TaxID=2729614 RepID=A0A850Q5T7_9RHOB|nr:response regulator [Donghicola mangrovi]NVO21779.1 response regulator [Donghicola mangrovi]NVO26632.1 response regulator [Donghicola mangrovi]